MKTETINFLKQIQQTERVYSKGQEPTSIHRKRLSQVVDCIKWVEKQQAEDKVKAIYTMVPTAFVRSIMETEEGQWYSRCNLTKTRVSLLYNSYDNLINDLSEPIRETIRKP